MNSRTKGRRLDGYYPEYVLFDIETTGLSPATDEIIELSAVKVSRGDIIDTFDTLIRPNRKIPRSATAINGITNDMVRDAPTLEQKLPAFLDFIRGYKLVGHNIHTFDTNFIYDAALTLCGCSCAMIMLIHSIWHVNVCHSCHITVWGMSVNTLALGQKGHIER